MPLNKAINLERMTSSNRMLVSFYVHLKVEVYYLCIWKNKLQTLTHSSKEPQSPASLKTLEVFRNEILAGCQDIISKNLYCMLYECTREMIQDLAPIYWSELLMGN